MSARKVSFFSEISSENGAEFGLSTPLKSSVVNFFSVKRGPRSTTLASDNSSVSKLVRAESHRRSEPLEFLTFNHSSDVRLPKAERLSNLSPVKLKYRNDCKPPRGLTSVAPISPRARNPNFFNFSIGCKSDIDVL